MPISLHTGSEVDQASYQDASWAISLAVRRTGDDSANSPPTVKVKSPMTGQDRHKVEAAL